MSGFSGLTTGGVVPGSAPQLIATHAGETVIPAETPDPIELPDDQVNPDEAEPLPPDEPVKTDPVPEEPQ